MFLCAECEQPITDRHFLWALGRAWHEDCLRCACCKCRLSDLGDRFYSRAGLALCARDYVRLFGLAGQCALCAGEVAPGDWVMPIGQDNNIACCTTKVHAHLDCFACSQCKGRFCVGEPFRFQNGLIFCEKHFIVGFEATRDLPAE